MNKNNSDKAKVCCKSCGAIFENTLPMCPYCKSTNVVGSEIEYMNKLENIKENVEVLQDVHVEEGKKELKKQSKKVALIIMMPIIIIVCLFLLYNLFDFISNNSYDSKNNKSEKEKIEELLWEQETFPKLNELYEKEEYSEIVNLVRKYEEEGLPIEEWEHYEFASVLELLKYIDTDVYQKEITLTKTDYEDLLWFYIDIEKTRLSQNEEDHIQPLKKELLDIINQKIKVTEDDISYLKSLSFDELDKEIRKMSEGSKK